MSWIKIVYGFITCFIVLLLCLYFLHPITNLVGDLGYYLKIGEIIYTTHTIPATNLFSYTNPHFPFINPNWLSEVLFYIVHNTFGFNGLIILSIATIAGAFGIIFTYAARKFDYFSTLLISLLSIHILYERTEVKPELFSYLFLAIFITLLYKNKEKFTKWIFVLIPLMVLWVNTHIYFFIGILVVLLFTIDAVISQKDKINSKKTLSLFSLLAGVIAVSIINPQAVQGALYPFIVLNNYAFPVEENSNFFKALSFYNDTTFPYFGIMAALLWTSISITFKKLQPVDIFLAIIFTVLGFFAVRTFPLFVIGVFIPVVKSLSIVLHYLYKYAHKERLPFYKAGTLIAICLLLIPTISLNLQIHGLGLGVRDGADQAVNFLKKNTINGPIYNNYDLGNYLVYRLYPEEKVFIDGRPEAYPKTFFENIYIPMQQSPTIFSQVSDKYTFNVIVIKHTDTSPDNILLMKQLTTNNNWKMVYLNSTVVIFLKNTPNNTQIIKDNLITQDTVHLSQDDLNDKANVGQLVNFFRNIGWDKPWLNANLKYLEYEPNNCSALQNASYIYQKMKSPNAQTYINKFLTTCSK